MKIIYLLALTTLLFSCEPSAPHDEFDAEIEVEYYVESKLKSPATADFGGQETETTGDNTYHCEGYVDSQNGFGATVRNYYECDVEFTPNGKKRTIKNFTIE